ncbi:MAG TPA: class I SAM-dependent methyltransferase [Candidatus Binataceae bacterium]|nr:class I SAM-dependent methyltransferase [Candidatus Binataceae bacterium]
MAEADRPNWFARIDESEDEDFYSVPRRVVHIDDGAIAAAGEIYASRIAEGSKILDLMSSWRSHLPERMHPSHVTGLGMNREEMEDNTALNEIVVHNVNRNPRLPFPDQSFDAAVMTVSVQYLTNPIALFADTARVLRPGGCFITTFSNRMFPTKAVALWRGSSEENRVEIVKQYFAQSGAFENIEVIDMSHRNGPPSDPIWGVLGYKPR